MLDSCAQARQCRDFQVPSKPWQHRGCRVASSMPQVQSVLNLQAAPYILYTYIQYIIIYIYLYYIYKYEYISTSVWYPWRSYIRACAVVQVDSWCNKQQDGLWQWSSGRFFSLQPGAGMGWDLGWFGRCIVSFVTFGPTDRHSPQDGFNHSLFLGCYAWVCYATQPQCFPATLATSWSLFLDPHLSFPKPFSQRKPSHKNQLIDTCWST